MPPRYADEWFAPVRERAEPIVARGGGRILDVGSGRRPTFAAEARAPGTWYAGLDVSGAELARAGPGDYDETIVADLVDPVDRLRDRFDLIVSWQVLEHVSDMALALGNLRSYLRPGGRLVAMFSGGLAIYALVNRVLPVRLGARLGALVTRRPRDTVFPAFYDRCTDRALRPLLAGWGRAELLPLYRGGNYFEFSPVALAAYLGYEELVYQRQITGLATHYILCAER